MTYDLQRDKAADRSGESSLCRILSHDFIGFGKLRKESGVPAQRLVRRFQILSTSDSSCCRENTIPYESGG